MAADAGWFYEDELSRLRWEWVAALRDYARGDSPAQLRRVESARDAYVGRAQRLRTSGGPPAQRDATSRSSRMMLPIK